MAVSSIFAKMANRTITADDLAAAARLRAIWDREQQKLGFTQESAADQLGWTQGAVSQYLGGDTALGIEAVLKFAKFLRCSPTEIRPEHELLNLQNEDEFLSTWRKIPASPAKATLQKLIQDLADQSTR